METIEAIRKRRSIRSYRPKPVPDDVINEVVEAGFCAPAAHGKQPWHVVVVKDAEVRRRLAGTHEWAKFIDQAPVAIAICVDRNESDTFWVEDGSAFMENLMLAARAEGLGTCWIGIRGAVYNGVDSEKTVREILGIPDHIGVLAITPLGYPTEEAPTHDLRVPASRVHIDRFHGSRENAK